MVLCHRTMWTFSIFLQANFPTCDRSCATYCEPQAWRTESNCWTIGDTQLYRTSLTRRSKRLSGSGCEKTIYRMTIPAQQLVKGALGSTALLFVTDISVRGR